MQPDRRSCHSAQGGLLLLLLLLLCVCMYNYGQSMSCNASFVALDLLLLLCLRTRRWMPHVQQLHVCILSDTRSC